MDQILRQAERRYTPDAEYLRLWRRAGMPESERVWRMMYGQIRERTLQYKDRGTSGFFGSWFSGECEKCKQVRQVRLTIKRFGYKCKEC